LDYAKGVLSFHGNPIDLIYNRLTDFYLADAANDSVRSACIDGAVIVTPHPTSHALFANKLNLTTLTNAEVLRSIGVSDDTIEVLLRGIPKTVVVNQGEQEKWWSERKQWFFKPAAGFGSRGTYRGDKITRRVLTEIVNGQYVAQAFSPPSERYLAENEALKFDVRCYAFEGKIDLLSARLYQGQTTNFRTLGGGFAPVYLPWSS
jgi:hypothetical protein